VSRTGHALLPVSHWYSAYADGLLALQVAVFIRSLGWLPHTAEVLQSHSVDGMQLLDISRYDLEQLVSFRRALFTFLNVIVLIPIIFTLIG
jgi:hypothetical protein